MRGAFRRLAELASWVIGTPAAFAVVLLVNLGSFLAEPVWGFHRWNIIYNDAASVVIFLVLFLLQNEQDRYARTVHLKLDELLRGTPGPRKDVIGVEESGQAEIGALRRELDEARHEAEGRDRRG